jgi:DNA-binding MarR family transcriptional regulator
VKGYGYVGEEVPAVIRVLLNTDYTWRYVSGITRDSGVSRQKVEQTLDWLEKNGLAYSTDGKTGKIWALTGKGREVFSNLANTHVS